MVDDTQIYWGSVLRPSFGIKEVEEDVSETGSFSVLS
jgi:hypothetical protein